MKTINGITYRIINNKVHKWDDNSDKWVLSGHKEIPIKQTKEVLALIKQAPKVRKKYPVRGEDSGVSKFTDEEIRYIRHSYENTKTTQVLMAQTFGVHLGTIRAIIAKRTWGHVI